MSFKKSCEQFKHMSSELENLTELHHSGIKIYHFISVQKCQV